MNGYPKNLMQINRLSPKICRLMARKCHGQKAMSHADIAFVSGLARSTVVEVSKRNDWNSLSLETIHRFSMGCGVNLLKPMEAIRSFKRSNGHYIKTCTGPQKKLYARLLKVEKKAGPAKISSE